MGKKLTFFESIFLNKRDRDNILSSDDSSKYAIEEIVEDSVKVLLQKTTELSNIEAAALADVDNNVDNKVSLEKDLILFDTIEDVYNSVDDADDIIVEKFTEVTLLDDDVIVEDHTDVTFSDDDTTVNEHTDFTFSDEDDTIEEHTDVTILDDDAIVEKHIDVALLDDDIIAEEHTDVTLFNNDSIVEEHVDVTLLDDDIIVEEHTDVTSFDNDSNFESTDEDDVLGINILDSADFEDAFEDDFDDDVNIGDTIIFDSSKLSTFTDVTSEDIENEISELEDLEFVDVLEDLENDLEDLEDLELSDDSDLDIEFVSLDFGDDSDLALDDNSTSDDDSISGTFTGGVIHFDLDDQLDAEDLDGALYQTEIDDLELEDDDFNNDFDSNNYSNQDEVDENTYTQEDNSDSNFPTLDISTDEPIDELSSNENLDDSDDEMNIPMI